ESTLALSASDYEGFGYGVVEAMAAGLPAVVRPGHPLAGLDSGSVQVIDFREPQAAAGQLAALLGDGARLPGASRAARGIARRFSWGHVTDLYDRAYERAVGSELLSRRSGT